MWRGGAGVWLVVAISTSRPHISIAAGIMTVAAQA
eukprot:COSAG02_NODE_4725_length_5049_cov_8.780202_10_plen_35_part_00